MTQYGGCEDFKILCSIIELLTQNRSSKKERYKVNGKNVGCFCRNFFFFYNKSAKKVISRWANYLYNKEMLASDLSKVVKSFLFMLSKKQPGTMIQEFSYVNITLST